jgi:hypothetical protein
VDCGIIEKGELPDEAAVEVELVGERPEDVTEPVQLHRPAGVQLENVGSEHQHIDLIYFARARGPTKIHADYDEDRVGW